MRRIVATIGLILLGGCIIATIICAIAGVPGNVLLALLFCDIVIPCVIFGYSKLIGLIKKNESNNKNNVSDDNSKDNQEVTDK